MSYGTSIDFAKIAPQAGTERKGDLYSVRLLGDPGLHVAASEVESREKIRYDLIAALKRENGKVWTSSVGLAAQQVGGTQRITIASWDGRGIKFDVCINLRIVDRSPELELCPGEGCLSIPHFRTSTRRHTWVIVEYRDTNWQLVRRRLEGFAAQIAQHECDHLDGKLITDGVGRNQRRQAERLVTDYLARKR